MGSPQGVERCGGCTGSNYEDNGVLRHLPLRPAGLRRLLHLLLSLSPRTTAPTQHKWRPCRSRSPHLATLRQPIAASERAHCREGQERAAGRLKLGRSQMNGEREVGQGEGALEGVDGHHAASTPQCRTMVCVQTERTGQSALRSGRHAGATVGRRARARGERWRRRWR